jgi:hypothetical protein
MKKLSHKTIKALLTGIIIFTVAPAFADYTYTYIGNPFYWFYTPSMVGNQMAPNTLGNNLTISFSVQDLLRPNGYNNSISSYYNLSVSDGITSISTKNLSTQVENFGMYELSTNANGIPINWSTVAQLNYNMNINYPSELTTYTRNQPYSQQDFAMNYSYNPNDHSTNYQLATDYSPGVWSVVPTVRLATDKLLFVPALIPEPETYAMLLAGLGLLGFTARRRKNYAA